MNPPATPRSATLFSIQDSTTIVPLFSMIPVDPFAASTAPSSTMILIPSGMMSFPSKIRTVPETRVTSPTAVMTWFLVNVVLVLNVPLMVPSDAMAEVSTDPDPPITSGMDADSPVIAMVPSLVMLSPVTVPATDMVAPEAIVRLFAVRLAPAATVSFPVTETLFPAPAVTVMVSPPA